MRPKEHIVPRGAFRRNVVALTAQQKKTVLASFLGWTLDAFDFFLLTFLLTDIATEFNTDVPQSPKRCS
ncbi:hypothetical protein X749_07805 [Mesorhizobium sp. LNJC391B00]|nr:hypothetical protein X749_07805 [Mesorhizobium sp. LNJC391B00]